MSQVNENNSLGELCKALLQVKDEIEYEKFLRDLCTPRELANLTERWKIASLLYDNLSYREIGRRTQASTSTITRVARYAQQLNSGYKLILDRTRE
ncbi:MAG: transcriptional regulator [Bacteriovoracaceae bacterium]|nr:transcriptional regulator [Bacteriovoracaceae bacterium]